MDAPRPLIARLLCLCLILKEIGFGDGQCIVPPSMCPNEFVKFYLTTRRVSFMPVVETLEGVQQAPVVKGAPIKVIIHGTNGSLFASPNAEFIPRYLAVGDFNVLTIDYGPLVPVYCFGVRRRAVGPVGGCLARFLSLLYAAFPGQLTPAQTHLIGYSLGAHVAAAAAHRLRPMQVARITGLDPSGLGYERFALDGISDWADRLDPWDAPFVDVYHSAALGLGSALPLGTVDFYLGKGYAQPGCPVFSLRRLFIFTFPVVNPLGYAECNHRRSVEVYAETIGAGPGGAGLAAPCQFGRPNLGLRLCAPTGSGPSVPFGEPAPLSGARGTFFVPAKVSFSLELAARFR